ncbi:zinc finger CCCH domain-containing protein 3 isoform X2 [Cephus cinctus]|uniref:Zinc finger CCCH domain-containing protein 3 isoform X2 n=1 Tax=Cephus cinctus TaxID=211228 RepID=A0AAJ7BPN5_CEPCN|nr:zinc finger CCCH domain-containing protein 3 isoform X2 [Cephus cinctus]
MEDNALKEISYLTHLLEQHKKYHVTVREQVPNVEANSSKAFNFPCSTNQLPLKSISQGTNQYSYVKFQTTSTKVHVNPNFNPVNTTIHINPKLRGKTSIYVNPKVIKNIAAKQQIESSKESKQDSNPNIVETKYERSVHVNPKLMQKLSSTVPTESKSHNEKVIKPASQYAVCSKSKLIKSIVVSPVTSRRSLGSSLVSVSKRKLIRMKSNVKGSSGMALNSKHKRIVNSGIRKTKVATKYKLVMDIEKKFASTTTVTKPIGTTSKIQPNKYKIDRTATQGIEESKIVKVPSLRKLEGCTTALLRIGGVLYKSSRNQLIRSNIHTPSSKKKRYVINVQGDKFLMASDGKKLCRLSSIGESSSVINKSRISIGGITYVEKTPNVLVRATSKTIISNKVKQRSIQILRNKMRKNNQPCLFFQRFGYCANQVKSTCHKLHDKKQVALCKKIFSASCKGNVYWTIVECPMMLGPKKCQRVNTFWKVVVFATRVLISMLKSLLALRSALNFYVAIVQRQTSAKNVMSICVRNSRGRELAAKVSIALILTKKMFRLRKGRGNSLIGNIKR